MNQPLSESARKVQAALQALGLPCQVVELPASTRTAPEAAQAVGCQVGQIVKSLVFRTQTSRRAVLVLVSGSNRVNEDRLAEVVGEAVVKAEADFVREQSGFAVGGVPPVGHHRPLPTYIDQDLLQYAEVWAAAGTPHAVFKLNPRELPRITGGEVIKVN
ncbi:YbaK/EbsC family protein [Bellilinea sp.]|uniref:YbaK/EbsC family protein n=1 Tax=Bellilinea sp. TaxID=2838785 RepID=UPI002ADD459F|nr:YbaK/EbsC family protein [Bellilinea sp.]